MALVVLLACVASAAAQSRVYVLGTVAVAGEARWRLTVFDGASNAKLGGVTLGRGSGGSGSMVMSTDGTRIYVVNEVDATVSVVDTASSTVIHTLPRDILMPSGVVGGLGGPIEISPDGRRLYVYALGLRVIDTSSWQVIASPALAVNRPMLAMTASPDGARLYYRVAGGNTAPSGVVTLDTNSFTTIGNVALPGPSAGIDISTSPDGRYVYLPRGRDNGASTLTVYDTASNTVAHDRPVPNAFAVASSVSPNSAYLYVVGLNAQDQLYRFSSTTHLELSTTGGVGGYDVAFNADSSRAYVPTGSQLLVIDTGTHAVIRRITLSSTTDGSSRQVLVRGAVPIDPTPSNFRVLDLEGARMTVAWNQPASGPASGYVIEGGTAPGGVLGSIATGSGDTTFTFDAPTGTFYLRVRAVVASGLTPASNEIRVVVNVPEVPSAPSHLKGIASGPVLALSWRNTFGGGPPTALVLDVSGAATLSLQLPRSETFTFPSVPPGTYQFALRAVNGTGSSAASDAVTLTFPGTCSGVPQAPENLVLQRTGSRLLVRWEQPASGPAVTSYVLRASGAVNAVVPLPQRFIAADVPSGTYNIAVAAVNPCGTGVETVAQSITIP